MGLVALTLGFLALGAYIGRDLSGGWGILAFIASFGCIFGLNIASTRGNEQLAVTLLFGLGLLLGLALGPMLSDVRAGRSGRGVAGRGGHRRGSSRPSVPRATRPGATSRRGTACCSGRCSA